MGNEHFEIKNKTCTLCAVALLDVQALASELFAKWAFYILKGIIRNFGKYYLFTCQKLDEKLNTIPCMINIKLPQTIG